MLLDDYYSQAECEISFSRQQASHFAKHIADDFNPLHNPDAKLFCVPGDLLFALVLAKYGVSQHMRFTFAGMIDDTHKLHFSESETGSLSLLDEAGKEYLNVERSGSISREVAFVENLTRNYVTFSGHTFPHVLIPLMAEHRVMINPARPIIIYQSMEINLELVEIPAAELEFKGAHLEVEGKRGNVRLDFQLNHAGKTVGSGRKYMAMRGLRPFEQRVVDDIVASYMRYKEQ